MCRRSAAASGRAGLPARDGGDPHLAETDGDAAADPEGRRVRQHREQLRGRREIEGEAAGEPRERDPLPLARRPALRPPFPKLGVEQHHPPGRRCERREVGPAGTPVMPERGEPAQECQDEAAGIEAARTDVAVVALDPQRAHELDGELRARELRGLRRTLPRADQPERPRHAEEIELRRLRQGVQHQRCRRDGGAEQQQGRPEGFARPKGSARGCEHVLPAEGRRCPVDPRERPVGRGFRSEKERPQPGHLRARGRGRGRGFEPPQAGPEHAPQRRSRELGQDQRGTRAEVEREAEEGRDGKRIGHGTDRWACTSLFPASAGGRQPRLRRQA